MADFYNTMILLTIFLMFTNAFFLFSTGLPGTQDMSETLIIKGISTGDINDMNNKLTGILSDQNILAGVNDVNSNVSASSTTKNYLTLFQTWLFGALDTATLGLSTAVFNAFSLVGTIISMFSAMFFGYLFWVDFFIPPIAITPTLSLVPINMAIKIFLFTINVLGIYQIIERIFYAGTGVRG